MIAAVAPRGQLMPKTKCDCGDPQCPFPDMASLSKLENTEADADYFVKAVLWMQGHEYHDITTMCRWFKSHGIRIQFDDGTLQRALQKLRA
jgi:hypothetical protein